MLHTLRILFLLVLFALASNAKAGTQQKRSDRLRWNDITQQEQPKAVLSDAPSAFRVVPTRPERVNSTTEAKTQPSHGRPLAALHSHHQHSFDILARPLFFRGLALLSAPCAKSFIALRHIIR